MDRQPLIGITAYYVERSEINKLNRVRGIPGEDLTIAPLDYSRSVEEVGGVPVILPVMEEKNVDNLLERLDGLLLAGGEDIDPWLYGERPQKGLGMVNSVRDKFEVYLVKQALKKGLPILGICRGLQLVNVVLGGSLYQDLALQPQLEEHTFLQYPKGQYTHKVHLKEQSKLRELFGQDSVWVNSFHHQGVKSLGNGLSITAVSDDGLIEGVQGDGDAFILAVQWHPETITETSKEHLVLFDALVKEGANRIKRRDGR